jgi:hypothetical protein
MLAMLFMDGCGRHHSCPSSNWLTQCLILSTQIVKRFVLTAR